jgi:hypothetical protein
MCGIQYYIMKCQLPWAGNVLRMSDDRVPKQLLYGELGHGNRRQGRPYFRFKDSLKINLKLCSLNPENLESLAQTERNGVNSVTSCWKVLNVLVFQTSKISVC